MVHFRSRGKMKLENLKNPTLDPKEKRKKSYPSIEDQLDMLWHDISNGTLDTTGIFYKGLSRIKNRFPIIEEPGTSEESAK